ncbi:MAG: twin-arginine translocase subunit TatB [Rhodobacteraceae bacterium]|nr:twin-arginine translocase subunit TatB [Paracoccaceae bacterium]
MFDLGMSELLVIGVVALVVIGPKDLPELFRSLGKFTAKLRAMGREFSRAMEAAADEAGVKDVAKDLKAVTSPRSLGLDAVKDAADKFQKWDPLKNAATPTKPVASGTIRGPVLAEGSIPPTPAAAVPAAEAPAAVAEVPAPAAPMPGPATQTQFDKKAAKAAILRETAEKLKALDAAPAAAPAEAPAKKPRAPRKPKTPEADA